ncbi:hypothetical protein [Adonisia turfae]|uniref:hypothetical protein n=1 Tax=Adonisia turfae TaxID=2950184 RepID=UPI0013CF7B50|nr:hypothetical protein [Adonisia turfae]
MKTLVDGLTCLMMLMIIMLCSKILFPQKTQALLEDANQRWENAHERLDTAP